MVTVQDITNFHKGENIEVHLTVNDSTGSPVANPAALTVDLVISDTRDGAALGGVKHRFTLADPAAALFTLTLAAADLSAVTEGEQYHYNVWSIEGQVAVLRAKGKLILMRSIAVPA